MNENQLTIVKHYEIIKPLIHKIDSVIDNFDRGCHNKDFYTFKYRCTYHNKFTNFGNNDAFNLTISDKNMGLYELNKKLKTARQRGFIFNQIHKITIKNYSSLSKINIMYYLKHQIPIMHRKFFRITSHNPNYIRNHCNDRNNLLHFACRKWMIKQ